MHDQLADHRIVMGWDRIASLRMRIKSHAKAARYKQAFDQARARLEILVWIFCINAALDRGTMQFNIGLLERQRFTRGDTNLSLDQIDTGDHFGYWMFNLDARVDFDEVKITFLVDNKLNRPGVLVTHFDNQPLRRFTNRLARLLWKKRGWTLFNQLLMATLNRAIAFVQMARVAVQVRNHLNFNVTWTINESLQVNACIAKRGLGFCLSLLQSDSQGLLVGSDSHSLATTACSGFDQHRVTDFLRRAYCVFFVGNQAIATRHNRHVCGHGHGSSTVFIAQLLHRFRSWTDEVKFATANDFVEM